MSPHSTPTSSAASQAATPLDAVVFDLGGVLIDWNPRYLFRRIFGDDVSAMEYFLAEVCSPAWNARQDAGRSWDEAVEEATLRHPAYAEAIRAYRDRWAETLGDAIEPTVEVLAGLRAAGHRLYALTNWSRETFPIARQRFPFLAWFDGILVSGEEGMMKPDPAIYRLLLSRYGLDAARTVFIDDTAPNVVAAAAVGLKALRFHDAAQLRRDLAAAGISIGGAGPA